MRGRQKNGLKCLECGQPLLGRQQKFCSRKHMDDYHNRKKQESGYFNKRRQKIADKKRGVCIVCGKKLPKQKQKYCSYTCQRIKKNLWNATPFENDKNLPTYAPFYCDECGGRVIQERECEYVCEKCGLVWGI